MLTIPVANAYFVHCADALLCCRALHCCAQVQPWPPAHAYLVHCADVHTTLQAVSECAQATTTSIDLTLQHHLGNNETSSSSRTSSNRTGAAAAAAAGPVAAGTTAARFAAHKGEANTCTPTPAVNYGTPLLRPSTPPPFPLSLSFNTPPPHVPSCTLLSCLCTFPPSFSPPLKQPVPQPTSLSSAQPYHRSCPVLLSLLLL
jgi:hypothetical protein